MIKSTLIRVPIRFHDFLKEKAKSRNTKISQEAGNMLDKYLENESTLKKLEGKRVFIIK